MPKAARTFEVEIDGDGAVRVKYNAGPTPLPIAWTGSELSYASRQELTNAIMSAEDSINEEMLVLMALADGWTKADPSMTSPQSAKKREMQLDLLGGNSVIKTTG